MIALLYDVHGNLPALDAVLADARSAGATEWLVGGDVALFCAGWVKARRPAAVWLCVPLFLAAAFTRQTVAAGAAISISLDTVFIPPPLSHTIRGNRRSPLFDSRRRS